MAKLFTVQQDINQLSELYKLVPCPFCGSTEIETHSRAQGRVWFVVCTACHTTGPEPLTSRRGEAATEAEAVMFWNRRA